ncbi:hypothetical protein ACP70R_020247 [Stipagrostis hirtigluma subsp. patula]
MASPAPRHIPAAAAAGSGYTKLISQTDSPSLTDTGNKENICEDGGALLDCPAVLTEGPSSAKRKKKTAGFNLRKSIAWNPAFFTEDGVLDNSELSVLTGSQLIANGSPSSGVSGIMSPSCRPGRYGNTCLPREIASKSSGKLTAKCRSTENQGRKLFSSAKTPMRDEQKESAGPQRRSSARSIQKCIPRVPAASTYPYEVLGRTGHYTPKKVHNITSTAQMSRTPNKSQPSLPTVPRSTSSVTTVSKSNKKLAPVIAEQVHRIPGLPPKWRVNSISSGPSPENGVVPAVATICNEANGSAKCKTFQPHPQFSPSSSFGATASTVAKPSGLRAPSPSIGFFTKEKAHVSHGDVAKRNVGRCFAGNTSSAVNPPRYKQPEDLKGGFHLTKPLSTNRTTASNLLVLSVTRESNPNTLVCPEKESLSKVIARYSAKSADANNQGRPEVDCLLAGSRATTQPSSSEKNDGARNHVPTVHSDTSHVEDREFTKDIEPIENSCFPKAICPSTIEPVADSCLFKATCSSDKPIVGIRLSPSCTSSQVCTSNDLNFESKSDSGMCTAIDLENSYVGNTAPAVSLSEGDGYLDLSQDFDSCDNQNIEVSTLMESVESTIYADQVSCCSSSRDETLALADSNSDLNDAFCHEAKPSSTEESNSDSRIELETKDAIALKEAPLLHVVTEHNHNYRSTECSLMKPEAATPCVEGQHVSSVDLNMEDKMVLDTNKLSALESASNIEMNKEADRPRKNTILKDHLKKLVPFTEEWLAIMEACGQEVLEQKTGAVQNSPPEKTAPEPSPWSPVKRKAQDVGPFDCTKYSKIV